VPVREYDEWITKLPDGRKVRFSCQLLIVGFSASMEMLKSSDATIYTHTHTDLPAPTDRAQIEAEFADDLAKAKHRRGVYALARYRSAS
jgi:hypothetical protein